MLARSAAKLSAPRQARIARRPRVQALIEEGLRAGVCWLAAPAGYGKTTAVVDYLHATKAPYVWYRVDEGDQDVARFYHYLAQTLPAERTVAMPVFGSEYAERPREFARRFFRAYFDHLEPGTVIALDDLHDANTPEFRASLAVMLREVPEGVRCVCLSRTLPQDALRDMVLRGEISVIDQASLAFLEDEAHSLVSLRCKRVDKVDIAAAHGWAVGLLLLAERGATALPSADPADGGNALFDALGRHFFHTLSHADQGMLLELNLLPEISSDLANALIGSHKGAKLLERLYHGQMLISRVESHRGAFHLHDLLREFLDHRFALHVPAEEQARLRTKAATVLREAGRIDDAIALALQAGAVDMARSLIVERAPAIIAQGGRATFIEWCDRLPRPETDAWLQYWLGVAHMPDDAAAERCFARAWKLFEAGGDRAGQCLTVARTVLVKTDSWRTHEGLAVWTGRAAHLLGRGLPRLAPEDELLAWIGIVRALDFTDGDQRGDHAAGDDLAGQLLQRLSRPSVNDTATLRLLASEALIERAVSTGRSEVFEQAVDSVVQDLRDPAASPWALGMWLVAFGAAAGRYFVFTRRGFPYATAEDALRAAIKIGEDQSLPGVEFGGLYHLQLQMKLRSDFTEFSRLVGRLGEIADSRYSTQVAVVADCQAAMHTWQGDFPAAYRDCERFMAAIEAADEPLQERWPHYVTNYQVLLGDGRAREAVELLTSLLPRLEGGTHARTVLCIRAAVAVAAKRKGDETYPNHLRAFMDQLRDAQWPAILLNLPALLAELLADALEHGFDAELCRSMIATRRLAAPPWRPESWPWLIRIRLLGDFRIEREGGVLDLGAKAPTRALDILRLLAVSKDHACSLDSVQDALWPDLDGDQAKAACEQALHRLRKLLGAGDLIVQREGRLRLAADRVWVDLADWEMRLQRLSGGDAPQAALERLFQDFCGTPLFRGRTASWAQPVSERLQDRFVELAVRLGSNCEARGDGRSAQAYYLRALEIMPFSARLSHALIKARLAQDDAAGAIDEYARYERLLNVTGEGEPPPALRALVQPLLKAARLNAG